MENEINCNTCFYDSKLLPSNVDKSTRCLHCIIEEDNKVFYLNYHKFRLCYRCHCILNPNSFIDGFKKDYKIKYGKLPSKEKCLKVWNSEFVEIYCCDCFAGLLLKRELML